MDLFKSLASSRFTSVGCMFLGMYPFFLGCPIYWRIIVPSSLWWSFSVASVVPLSFQLLFIWVKRTRLKLHPLDALTLSVDFPMFLSAVCPSLPFILKYRSMEFIPQGYYILLWRWPWVSKNMRWPSWSLCLELNLGCISAGKVLLCGMFIPGKPLYLKQIRYIFECRLSTQNKAKQRNEGREIARKFLWDTFLQAPTPLPSLSWRSV